MTKLMGRRKDGVKSPTEINVYDFLKVEVIVYLPGTFWETWPETHTWKENIPKRSTRMKYKTKIKCRGRNINVLISNKERGHGRNIYICMECVHIGLQWLGLNRCPVSQAEGVSAAELTAVPNTSHTSVNMGAILRPRASRGHGAIQLENLLRSSRLPIDNGSPQKFKTRVNGSPLWWSSVC